MCGQGLFGISMNQPGFNKLFSETGKPLPGSRIGPWPVHRIESKNPGEVGVAKKPSAQGKVKGKVEGTRQTSKSSASGFKGTDKRGDLVGGRKGPSGKKTLLGG